MRPRWLAAGLLASLLLLGGCSPQSPSAAGQGQDAAGSAAPADASDPPVDPNTYLVAAVSPGGAASAEGPVSVKFRIEARPEIGTPVKIMVALIPAAAVQIHRLHGDFVVGEGLSLQSSRSFDAADLQGGTPLYRELTVVPQQSGVLSLNATILLDLDKSSETRTYTIPLVVADRAS